MIEGTARKEGIPIVRKDVYICNVVKCRPLRTIRKCTPEPDEMQICGEFRPQKRAGHSSESHLRRATAAKFPTRSKKA
ncbi:MAG: hypothetical protein U0Q18_29635 [Bryobacteraceae bacterium]